MTLVPRQNTIGLYFHRVPAHHELEDQIALNR